MSWPQPGGTFLYERPGISDPYPVSFNHYSHRLPLDPRTNYGEQHLLRGGPAARENPCVLCHTIARGSFLPISYNRHCADCHSITVTLPDGMWLPAPLRPPARPSEDAQKPERPRGRRWRPDDEEPQRRGRRSRLDDEESRRDISIELPHADSTILWRLRERAEARSSVDSQLLRLCGRCHDSEMLKQALSRDEFAQIHVPARVTVWLPPGIFEHSSHLQFACQQCHSVHESTKTSEINLPPSSTCRNCHERNRLPLWAAKPPW
jgi:hypothetical protein